MVKKVVDQNGWKCSILFLKG